MNTVRNRFCYNYKAPGTINTCCTPVITASSAYLSSITCTTAMSGVSQGTFLLQTQQACQQVQPNARLASTIQYTIQNASAISAQANSQLLQLQKDRYLPYQPYVYPVVPISVIQLQMATANVGVPVTPITCASGKGNQTLTT